MTVIGLQFDIAWENKPANFATVRRLLESAALERGALVVLPEMFATGFSMNAAAIAEARGGPTETFLSQAAKDFGITLVAGMAVRDRDGQARNKAVVFSPAGELICVYGKQRLFTPGGESQHYAPGGKGAVFEWQGCTVSPLVCYDLRFPELFRAVALPHRPELFVVIANFPSQRLTHWTQLLQARAIENQAYVLGVNRIGADPMQTYPGHSLLADPEGEIIADAGAGEGMVGGLVDLESLATYRQSLRFLDDLK